MSESFIEGQVALRPADAFEVFVTQIDTWWPRKGVFPYSFAPKTTAPEQIRFEPQVGGRLYETFRDGSEYEIGRIIEFDPPNRLVHTWRDPTWEAETTVVLSFYPDGEGSRYTMEQNGFEAIGQKDLIPYYDIGNRQTMAGFVAHCRALYELRQLQGK